jgi:hypothetical protein
MFTPIGAALAGAAPPAPDRQPVRRHSRLVGRCEGVFWRRTDRQEVRRVLLAARRYELAGRPAGRRNGPLGHVGLEVLELLGNLVSFRTGRLEPSLDTLTRLLRRSRAAVVRALRALRAHGFLDWLRRYEPTGQMEGPGPRVRQVSNAYRLSLPPRAARLLGRLMADPPLPEDVAHAREARAAELAAHKASLPLDQLALFEAGDSPLGQALASLGRHVQEREFTREPESQTKGIL